MQVENVVVWLRQPYEAEVVRELNKHAAKFHVIRRCADAADARASLQAGLSRILIADADATGLDATFLDDMSALGVFTLLLVADALENPTLGESARCEYGDPQDVIQTLTLGVKQHLFGLPTELPELETTAETDFDGKTIAFWGTHGAPGRSTLALNFAYQLSQTAQPVTLLDLDLQAPSLLQMTGEEPGGPGLSAALGLRNRGELDRQTLQEITYELDPNLHLLAGLTRADKWRQVSAEGLGDLLELCARQSHLVLDLGAGLGEADPSQLTFVPSREDINQMLLSTADIVIVVAKADAIGLTRLGHVLDDAKENGIEVDLLLINRAETSQKGRRLKHSLNRVLNTIAPNLPYIVIEESPEIADALLAATPVAKLAAQAEVVAALETVLKHLQNTKLASHMAQ
ncbi:MAG: cellulose synthase operon protein YhjQ/BcsQ [Actinomycetaceae bacterium]|nr:cellulose synthase operon protein YhjQ/BcsQ [Actinomycetaceae bacterium]